MHLFDQPVTTYMTSDLEVVGLVAPRTDVLRRFVDRRISSVPVVDDTGVIVGVVSRTDLLHAGRMQAPARRGAPVLIVPDRRAS